MNGSSNEEEAIELLQQLGLKEYEAKSFVALSRLPRGTAKEISENSDVPRTRVYDAVRVLESKGLVETQHSNPQQFRAVSVDEAVETLRGEYEARAESLRETLQGIEPIVDDEREVAHEVWALSGEAAIANRTRQLVDAADREVVLVLGHEGIFTERLADSLRAAQNRGVNLVVGTASEELRERVQTELPDATTFVSGLEWLDRSGQADDRTEINRLLLVDRNAILVSTFRETAEGEQTHERAVFGRGFDNGLVAIVRRLMATGLLPVDDPGADES